MIARNDHAPGASRGAEERWRAAPQGRDRPHYTELLNRLDGLRPSGPDQWRARCPAHGSRGLTLSVRDAGGTLLVRCFAGCSVADVLAAVGLELADLFDRPLSRGPVPYRERIRIDYRETLRAVRHETLLVSIIAADFSRSGELDNQDRRVLAMASSFLLDASEVAAR